VVYSFPDASLVSHGERQSLMDSMNNIIAANWKAMREFSFAGEPILELLPTQGSVELQRDAAGKVHHFHTHPAEEGGERICGAGVTIMLPAGALHKSEALDGGAIYAIATRPPTEPRSN
jgi:hypothetical protein